MQNFGYLLAAVFLLQLWPMALALNLEGSYLLKAKRGLDDPNNALANWKPTDETACGWTGVTCSAGAGGNQTVTAIDLSGLDLEGPFPDSLCLLPNLNFVSLSLNYINSSLRDDSLLGCSALTYLDLSQNFLVGTLPSFASLPLLRHLDLAGNNFTGAIPPAFASFPSLEILSLTANLLNETIPTFLGNISTLSQLNLSYNPFAAGSIPPSLANLTNLETIWLAGCGLVGEIPPALGRLRKLTNLDLSRNSLTGSIPDTLSGLSSVVQIELYKNSLAGSFPSGLSNLTTLLRLDASMNLLSGPIPEDIFSIPLLESLHLYQNRFNESIPATVAKAGKLIELRIFKNYLSGTIPAGLGSSSPLMFLDLSSNQLTGEIPEGVCLGNTLEELLLFENYLSGSLPKSLGQCRSLTRIRLANNRLSGEIPAGIWSLPRVWILELTDNSLWGNIPAHISGATNLSNLLLSRNQFSGNIPAEIGSLSKLYELLASDNRLTGPLPESLGLLKELRQIDLHNNYLSGELFKVESWKNLTLLNLAENSFSGEIPPDIGTLSLLNYLDLSGNVLTGEIPIQLQYLNLKIFNLSNNQLSGPIPPLFLNEERRSSFFGNPGLCWDPNGLCPGSTEGGHSHRKFLWFLVFIFVLVIAVFLYGTRNFYTKQRISTRGERVMEKFSSIPTSFAKLGFSEREILDSLQEDKVIGSGMSGKVYKVVLQSREFLAVKKLWKPKDSKYGDHKTQEEEDAYDAFRTEVANLSKIQHNNIVRLWCCYSHLGSNLLVYEHMPNGSLGDVLHGEKAGVLDWPARYKIAVDASEGLCYLHHDCVPPVVHRNVKSNNILLDAEFRAKVADFGIAKVVDRLGKGSNSISGTAGVSGCITPEFAYTLRVNEKSDIYCFGVVILELVTGKRAADPELGEKDLVRWACATIQQKGEESIMDPRLDLRHKVQIAKVLYVGLLCTSTLPMNRPSMRRVTKMLMDARAESKPPSYYFEKDGRSF
ncbi:Receptor-like protein kinase HSL1 [Platanthera guangdongensis]|uniref:Receptor-like protein kinase HSL1 n=1 Tax=Platanthera guangdongensis TaxID=2320717 RepID=A0ABR2MN62_9ASPA